MFFLSRTLTNKHHMSKTRNLRCWHDTESNTYGLIKTISLTKHRFYCWCCTLNFVFQLPRSSIRFNIHNMYTNKEYNSNTVQPDFVLMNRIEKLMRRIGNTACDGDTHTFNILPIDASRKSGKDSKRNVCPWHHTCQVSIERFATLSKFIKRQFLARERLRRGQYRWCNVKDDPCELAILRGLNKLDNLISIIWVNPIRNMCYTLKSSFKIYPQKTIKQGTNSKTRPLLYTTLIEQTSWWFT